MENNTEAKPVTTRWLNIVISAFFWAFVFALLVSAFRFYFSNGFLEFSLPLLLMSFIIFAFCFVIFFSLFKFFISFLGNVALSYVLTTASLFAFFLIVQAWYILNIEKRSVGFWEIDAFPILGICVFLCFSVFLSQNFHRILARVFNKKVS